MRCLLVLRDHFRLLLLGEPDKEISNLMRRCLGLLHVGMVADLVDSEALLGIGLGHALDKVEERVSDAKLMRILQVVRVGVLL